MLVQTKVEYPMALLASESQAYGAFHSEQLRWKRAYAWTGTKSLTYAVPRA